MTNSTKKDDELRSELAGYINAYGRYINDDGTPRELLDEIVDMFKKYCTHQTILLEGQVNFWKESQQMEFNKVKLIQKERIAYGIKEKRDLLLRLTQHGHGGGNWRRLVESELAKLDEGEL